MSSQATQHDIALFREADNTHAPRTFVIAEIGVNHDGNVKRAIELVEDAKRAGADAIKLQLFNPDRLLSNQALLATYQQGKATDAKALLAGLMLRTDQIREVLTAASVLGMLSVVTPFSLEDIEDLAELPVDVVKIASPDAVNYPLLQAAAGLNKPLLISTGTCELEELQYAAALLKSHNESGCLLQCVSSYPTPLADAGLAGMAVMREQFGLPVGYSDHTQEISTGAMAVCAGAVVIEKHLTYDCNAEGPDHSASMIASDFAAYIKQIRNAEAMMGPRFKGIKDVERDVRLVSRQSVCAARDLKAGQILEANDLTVRRPGNGIAAKDFEQVIGQKLQADKQLGDLLQREDVEL